MELKRTAGRVFVEKHGGKWLLGGPRRRWQDNINMSLKEIRFSINLL
jgi:hypothetical protein